MIEINPFFDVKEKENIKKSKIYDNKFKYIKDY